MPLQRSLAALILAGGLLPTQAAALNYRDPKTGIDVLASVTVAYGLRMRTEDTDEHLVSPAHGGKPSSFGSNGNLDDGTLNYDKGDLVSNMVRASGELTLGWRNFGVFLRGYAFYDYENDHNNRERTQLGGNARDQVGSDAKLQDAYLSARFIVGGIPLQLRLGDQVVNWGESRFFPASGVDVANALNIPLIQQPTSSLRDLRIPAGMLWGSALITPELIVEAYYVYDWEKSELPATGTYFSTQDGLAPDGTFIQATSMGNQFGTDLTQLYGLPVETLEAVGIAPFDRHFMQVVKRLPDDNSSDSGQFGISIQSILPRLNDSMLALYYARYHAHLPSVGIIAAPVSSYAEYSVQAVSKLASELQQQGVGAAESNFVANLNQLSSILNEVAYFGQYPEDIDMLGLSFNTTTRRGTAVFGEVAYHFDAPIAIHSGELLPDVFPGAGRGNPFPLVDFSEFSLEEIARDFANQRSDSFIKLDKTFSLVGATQLFGPRLGASQTLLNVEFAWLHIWDAPDPHDLYMAAPGLIGPDYQPRDLFATEDSWGYRIGGGMVYNNVFGGVNLSPRIIWAHDVDGISPSGAGPFLEGRKTLTIGLQAEYLTRLKVDLTYIQFRGAGRQNLINDRDNISFSIRYDF